MNLDLSQRHALVTGGSSDIGRAICLELAKSGSEVSFAYFSDHEGAARTEEALAAVMKRPPLKLRVNFGDKTSTADFVKQVRDKLPRVDVLISNAASGVFKPALELTARHLGWAMEVNGYALLNVVQGLMGEPALLPRGASIVCLSSLGAVRAIPQYGALAASKAALEALARQLALELGPRGIRLNVVSPGLIETRALQLFPNREQLLEAANARTPMGRLATAEDVARVVVFLASEAAQMIHGQTIDVDGGYAIVG